MPRRRVSRNAEREARRLRLAEINARLWSLTEEQARALREARDTPGGAYVPLTARGDVMHALVDGGAAEYREARRWSDTTRGPRDPTPIGWLTDYYIIPTEWGLKLLKQ